MPLISLPLAAVLSDRWLADFVYRVDVTWSAYVLVALVLMLVTGATLGVQSMKAAWMNPVENLWTD